MFLKEYYHEAATVIKQAKFKVILNYKSNKSNLYDIAQWKC